MYGGSERPNGLQLKKTPAIKKKNAAKAQKTQLK